MADESVDAAASGSARPLASPRIAQFAASGLAAVMIMSAVIAMYSRNIAVEELRSLSMGQHELLARTLSTSLYAFMRPALDASKQTSPESLAAVPEIKMLRSVLGRPLDGLPVSRLKIYDAAGRVIYSTDGAQIGDAQHGNDGFMRAMQGRTIGEMVYEDDFNVSDGVVEGANLLETYVPIQDPASGRIVGVFEVYSDMTALLHRIDKTQYRLVMMVLAISLAAFLVLSILFRRTETALRVEEESASRFLRELERARDTLEQNVEIRTRELAESEQRFQDVAEAAGEYIWETDTRGRIVYVSDRVQSVLGYSPDEVIGVAMLDLCAPVDRDRVDSKAFARDAFSGVEHRCITKEGAEIWQVMNGVVRRDACGRILGHRGAAHEVTARKQTERSLRLFSLVIDQSSEVVLMTDPKGQITYVNPTFTRVSGYEAEEALGRTPRLLKSDSMPEHVYTDLWKTISDGHVWRGELCNRRKDGSLFWNLVSVFPIHDNDGERIGFVGLQSDISQRKRAEEALQMEEARLRAIMDSAPDAIITSNQHGRIDMANPATERLFGYARHELLGSDVTKLMAEPYAEQHDQYLRNYLTTGEARIIGVGGREVWGLHKDGRRMPLELGVGEFTVGDYRGFVGVLRDLTERKAAERELERTRQQYFHRERTAAIGQLAAGIVHELGNPVAAISGAVGLLRSDRDAGFDGEHENDPLTLIEAQVERLAAMTREISDVARPHAVEQSLMNLNEVIRGVERLMRFDARIQDIDLRLELDPELPAVFGSTDQITQVLINLVLNAVDACAGMAPKSASIVLQSTHDDTFASICVRDNGVGMAPEVLEHATQPYFTTKTSEQGLGLGLSLCRDIVTAHGGDIQLESESGMGSSVTVRFSLLARGHDEACS